MSGASDLFELLAAARRRRLLFLLCERERVDLPEGLLTRPASTAGGVAGGRSSRSSGETRAGEVPGSGVTPRDADEVELDLHHRHLPKLEDRGLVECGPDERTVSRGPAFEEVEPALRALAENADAFPQDLL